MIIAVIDVRRRIDGVIAIGPARDVEADFTAVQGGNEFFESDAVPGTSPATIPWPPRRPLPPSLALVQHIGRPNRSKRAAKPSPNVLQMAGGVVSKPGKPLPSK